MGKTTKSQAKRLAKDSMKKLMKLEEFMIFQRGMASTTPADIQKVRKMVLELRKIGMKL